MGVQEFTQKQTYLSRQLRQTNLSLGAQKSIFLATHPALNKLSQAMSIFGQISRSALSIMNALNLATIASNSFTSQEFDLKMQMLEVTKKLNLIGPDTPENHAAREELLGQWRELNAEIDNVRKQAKAQEWNDFSTKLAGIGEAISTAFGTGLTLFAFLKPAAFKAALITFGEFGASLGGAIMAGLSKAFGLAALVEFFSMMGRQLAGEKDIAQGWEALVEIFTQDIPMAIGKASIALTQFFLTDLPNWARIGFTQLGDIIKNITKGITDGIIVIINTVIKAINFLIAQWNKASNASGGRLPKITPLQELKTSDITSGKGSVETAPIPGVLTGMTASGNTYVTVQGSIWSEKELMQKFDDFFKSNLKRVGFG